MICDELESRMSFVHREASLGSGLSGTPRLMVRRLDRNETISREAVAIS